MRTNYYNTTSKGSNIQQLLMKYNTSSSEISPKTAVFTKFIDAGSLKEPSTVASALVLPRDCDVAPIVFRKQDTRKRIAPICPDIQDAPMIVRPSLKRPSISNAIDADVNLTKIISQTYILNLDRRFDRRVAMEFKLDKLGINRTDRTFCSAIDGHVDSVIKRKYLEYIEKFTNPSIRLISSANVIACAGSMFKYFQQAADSGYRHLLFLEDDVAFHRDMATLTIDQNIANVYDVIYIGYNTERYHCLRLKSGFTRLSSNISSTGQIYGMYGLLLSLSFLKYLTKNYNIDHIIGLNQPIDCFFNHIRMKHPHLKFFIYHKPMILPDVMDSDLRDSRSLDDFCTTRGYTLSEFNYVRINSEIKVLFSQYINNNLQIPPDVLLSELATSSAQSVIYGNNKRFVFIIPSFNNSKWYKRNLDSILGQVYPFWRAIYIDDHSSDKTYDLVTSYIRTNCANDRFVTVVNPKRMMQSYSRYIAYQMCDDDEICVFLDGDDWLIDCYVLNYLNDFYLKHSLDATYQGYLNFHEGKIVSTNPLLSISYPESVLDSRSYRQHEKWLSCHLRTCQAKYVKTVRFYDFIDPSGKIMLNHSDVVESNAFLESIDSKRHRPVDKCLMIYNMDNAITHVNSHYNVEQIQKGYRDLIKKVVKEIPMYKLSVKKSTLCLIDSESSDVFLMVMKYLYEIKFYADILVVPFRLLTNYHRSVISKYDSCLQLNQYSDISADPNRLKIAGLDQSKMLNFNDSCAGMTKDISVSIIINNSDSIDENIGKIISYIPSRQHNCEILIMVPQSKESELRSLTVINTHNVFVYPYNVGFTSDLLYRKVVSMSHGKWIVMINSKCVLKSTHFNHFITCLMNKNDNIGMFLPNQSSCYVRAVRKKAYYDIPNIKFTMQSIFDPIIEYLISEKYLIDHYNTKIYTNDDDICELNRLHRDNANFIANRKTELNIYSSAHAMTQSETN